MRPATAIVMNQPALELKVPPNAVRPLLAAPCIVVRSADERVTALMGGRGDRQLIGIALSRELFKVVRYNPAGSGIEGLSPTEPCNSPHNVEEHEHDETGNRDGDEPPRVVAEGAPYCTEAGTCSGLQGGEVRP